MESGMDPTKRLWDMSTWSVGYLTVSPELNERQCIPAYINLRKAVMDPIVLGISPVKALRSASNVTRLDSFPIDVGIVYRRALSFNRRVSTRHTFDG